MFETMSLYELQQYWWIIVSLLGGVLVFLMFVQGGQTMINSIGYTEAEKSLVVNALGRKWELTFTTLVLFGGACFAAFPLFYATSFGGAYWLWFCILICFTIQAVAYEFRNKVGNFLGQHVYEGFLQINGSVGVMLLGVAVGSFFTGSNFEIDNYNHSFWHSSYHGLENILNIMNLALAGTIFFLVKVLAGQYFVRVLDHTVIVERARKEVKSAFWPFLILFLFYVGMLLMSSGIVYDASTKLVHYESFKYLHNLIEMPLVLAVFAIGVVGVLTGVVITLKTKSATGIFFSSAGTVLTVFALLMIAGLNHTCFYPSLSSLQSSLHIENASSARYTLVVMSYVSLLVPFVLAYVAYVWRLMDRKKISIEEVSGDGDSY